MRRVALEGQGKRGLLGERAVSNSQRLKMNTSLWLMNIGVWSLHISPLQKSFLVRAENPSDWLICRSVWSLGFHFSRGIKGWGGGRGVLGMRWRVKNENACSYKPRLEKCAQEFLRRERAAKKKKKRKRKDEARRTFLGVFVLCCLFCRLLCLAAPLCFFKGGWGVSDGRAASWAESESRNARRPRAEEHPQICPLLLLFIGAFMFRAHLAK